ncbi:hypothetical protein MG290_02100 [Flavobacterium sp. CBA20B-1]|uniref:hypothetical protein n=1 Tax=unclassified Flavobacterium TaxID=196869 RepID=UPI0022255751|nr:MULTISPECIES: hypothetical protein [unclassified Flavobacterium]WCM42486.1 hypothetical protein MG290_02100 [Flavobacterium sp. CBA20B-1]
MKKIALLFLATTFIGCTTDIYDGDTRIIVEGKLIYNNAPLQGVEVNVYPVYNQPTNGSITALYPSEININSKWISVSKTKTDASGTISFSIPRNEETNVYVIRITHNNDYRYFGYISNYNTNNYYVNLGTLNYSL